LLSNTPASVGLELRNGPASTHPAMTAIRVLILLHPLLLLDRGYYNPVGEAVQADMNTFISQY
jgi:hypothetical protein